MIYCTHKIYWRCTSVLVRVSLLAPPKPLPLTEWAPTKKKSVDQKTLFSFLNSKSLQTGRGWIRHIASSIKFFIHKCVFFQVLTTFFFLLTEQLITLISAAKEHNIEFIYAISPGLDITFSNQKEVSTLKRKLDQVCFLLCGHDAYGNIKLGRWKRKQLCSSM